MSKLAPGELRRHRKGAVRVLLVKFSYLWHRRQGQLDEVKYFDNRRNAKAFVKRINEGFETDYFGLEAIIE